MTATDDRFPLALRLRADGTGLPLRPDRGPALAPEDPALGLPAGLAAELSAWAGDFGSAEVRTFTRRGYRLAARLAAALGPRWVVLCHDEVHGGDHTVCWSCGGFHWRRDPHDPVTTSRTVQVRAEFRSYPVRFTDGTDFAPDDPVVGLGLSDALVDQLYAWSTELDELFDNRYHLAPEDEERLTAQGLPLARRLAAELGPDRTVEYHGLGGTAEPVVVTPD